MPNPISNTDAAPPIPSTAPSANPIQITLLGMGVLTVVSRSAFPDMPQSSISMVTKIDIKKYRENGMEWDGILQIP